MKQEIYELLRKYVAYRAVGKLGKIEITDDEIICYVDGRKIKKKEKYLHRYNLIFKCISSSEEIYKLYKVNKPVHYIVENIDFDKEINIMASMKKCHLTFDNCTFTAAVWIDFADHITFINNKYRASNYKNYYALVPQGHFYISTKRNKNEINKIEFINNDIDIPDLQIIPIIKASDKISHRTYKVKNSVVKLWLYAKNIMFNNSDVVDAESIEIGTDALHLENEYLTSKEIEIKSKKVTFENATVRSDVITIDSPSIEGKLPIYHKGLFINGVEVNKNESVIDNYDLKLQKHKLELINTLKKIESLCEDAISKEIKKQPLTRVLKK